MSVDNQGALNMALANRPTKRSKYVDIKYHYLCEIIDDKKINLQYMLSKNRLADPSTKFLKPQKFKAAITRMDVYSDPPQ